MLTKPALEVVEGLAAPLPWDAAPAYADIVAARADLAVAHPMRSQAEIDAVSPPANPYDGVTAGKKKKPVVYDPTFDAARLDIYAPVSADAQQKYWPVKWVAGDSALFSWAFRFDEHFHYKALGYLGAHKAWRFDPVWLAVRANYKEPVNDKAGTGIAEIYVSANSHTWLFAPYSWRQGDAGHGSTPYAPEAILPVATRFFLPANTWGRIWLLFTDLGPSSAVTDCFVTEADGTKKTVAEKWPTGRVVEMSTWIADETRDPIQIHNRVRLVQPYAQGISILRQEFDSGRDTADNPEEMHTWMNGLFQLKNPTDITALWQRPGR
jgi:hypothetical protein